MIGLDAVFESLPQLLATCAVLVVAEAVYVLFGFGAGLIAVGALAVLLPGIQDVVVLLALVNLPLELAVVGSSWRRVRWKGVFLICLGLVLGIPIGTWVLREQEATAVLTVLGAFLVVAGAVFLLVNRSRAVRWPAWTAPPVGLLSGVLAGLFGTGGPPLILYYQLGRLDKSVFRGNLMAVFLLAGLLRLPAYTAAGLITKDRVLASLAVLPAALLGGWLGHRIHLNLEEATFRRMVSIALVVIGLVLLLR